MVVELDRGRAVGETSHFEKLVVVVGVPRARKTAFVDVHWSFVNELVPMLPDWVPMLLLHPYQRDVVSIDFVLLLNLVIGRDDAVADLEIAFQLGNIGLHIPNRPPARILKLSTVFLLQLSVHLKLLARLKAHTNRFLHSLEVPLDEILHRNNVFFRIFELYRYFFLEFSQPEVLFLLHLLGDRILLHLFLFDDLVPKHGIDISKGLLKVEVPKQVFPLIMGEIFDLDALLCQMQFFEAVDCLGGPLVHITNNA